MNATVIARCRARMYTAFIAADGRAILNIAISESGTQRSISIEMDDQDRIAMGNDRAAHSVVERLLSHGRRLPTALPTPSASEPVRAAA